MDLNKFRKLTNFASSLFSLSSNREGNGTLVNAYPSMGSSSGSDVDSITSSGSSSTSAS